MKIGIISDIHEHPRNIEHALKYFITEKVDLIIGAGDLSNDAQSLSYVVGQINRAKIPATLIPGSHETLNDYFSVLQHAPRQISNGVTQPKQTLDGFDLILLPGSEFLGEGQFQLTNQGNSDINQGLCSINDLDRHLTAPQTTIIACHNPPKFSTPNSVDIAFYGQRGEGTVPGYTALLFNVILTKEEQFNIKRANRGYQPLTDKIAALFPDRNEKVISGHFHESAHRAHNRQGIPIPESTWSTNLYHLASNLDLYRIGIWETRINRGQLEVKYKNVNLGDFL